MASAPPKLGGDSMGWVGPAIMGGASLGGAALGGKAQKESAKIQAQTADKALGFARDQEAYKRQSYEQAMEAYRQQYNAAQARRDALLSTYGFSVPSGGSLTLSPQPATSQTVMSGPQFTQPKGGIRDLISSYATWVQSGGTPEGWKEQMDAAKTGRPTDTSGSLGAAYRGPWGGRNWSE